MGKSTRFAGLDIGTTKICAFVAEMNGSGVPRILGMGVAPSEGLRRGVVVDLARTVASIESAVEADERNMGVVLMDIGGGTTDLALFHEGGIRHTAILPLGGANVTNDIAIGLRAPFDKAEELKVVHGCAVASQVDASDVVHVPGVGGRESREIP